MFEKEILEVKKSYEEYCEFIKNDMPELHIEIEFIRGVSATLNSKLAYEGIYLVHINPELFSCSKEYRDKVLFHEFTHIYDCARIGKIDNYELTYRIIESYSEPHATQIDLMKSSGFKNIDDLIKVSNLIEVPLFSYSKTFNDYIATFDLFIKQLLKIQVPIVANYYFQNNFNYNLYYMGALIFGRKYVSNFKDDLSEYPPPIKNAYENIIQAVCDEDYLKCYHCVEELRKAY